MVESETKRPAWQEASQLVMLDSTSWDHQASCWQVQKDLPKPLQLHCDLGELCEHHWQWKRPPRFENYKVKKPHPIIVHCLINVPEKENKIPTFTTVGSSRRDCRV